MPLPAADWKSAAFDVMQMANAAGAVDAARSISYIIDTARNVDPAELLGRTETIALWQARKDSPVHLRH